MYISIRSTYITLFIHYFFGELAVPLSPYLAISSAFSISFSFNLNSFSFNSLSWDNFLFSNENFCCSIAWLFNVSYCLLDNSCCLRFWSCALIPISVLNLLISKVLSIGLLLPSLDSAFNSAIFSCFSFFFYCLINYFSFPYWKFL